MVQFVQVLVIFSLLLFQEYYFYIPKFLYVDSLKYDAFCLGVLQADIWSLTQIFLNWVKNGLAHFSLTSGMLISSQFIGGVGIG